MRPIETTDLIDLQLWCRDYHRNTRYPSSVERRFGIGFYQIYQGMAWTGTKSHAESFMAAVCHFLMVSEMLELYVEQHLNRDITKWKGSLDWRQLLYNLSLAQQHVIYYTNEKGIQRKKRYDQKVLLKCMVRIVETLTSHVDKKERKQGIYTATSIMTGVL